MATTAYSAWLRAGKPYRLMRPAKALQKALRAHGLTVYDYPNDTHLKALKPEDHTPFSATGWPVKSAVGVGHALDVMPRNDTAAARRENAAIARTLIAARNAGRPEVAWIKYLNWTDENGTCRQESWKPAHVTTSSTDKGHVHISGRSDCDDDPRADGWDPLASPASTGDDMSWDETIGAGYSPDDKGYGGHRFRTFAGYTWAGVDRANAALVRLESAAQADEVRDKANTAAIEALAAAIKAGGGSVDAAAIVTAVNAVRDEARREYAAAAERAAEYESRIADLQEQLARSVAAAEANLSPAERADLDGAP